MKKVIPAVIVIAIIAVMAWLAVGSNVPLQRAADSLTQPTTTAISSEPDQTSYECDGDAKMCPDGSSVGRTGLLCEFEECPSEDAKTASILTTMGQRMTGLNVTITPQAVVEDSRCPEGVQCIWAGRAVIRAKLESVEGSITETFEIGQTVTFGSQTIKFEALTPAPAQGKEIPDSSYRFVFTVTTG